MKKALLLLLIITPMFFSCTKENEYNCSGRVLRSNEPIKNAHLELHASASPNIFSNSHDQILGICTTDEDGSFSILYKECKNNNGAYIAVPSKNYYVEVPLNQNIKKDFKN